MIDTHAHVNFAAYKDDTAEVIKRALDNNVSIINVGSQFSTSERTVKIAEEYDGVYSAIGLHPFHLFEQMVKEQVDENELIEIKSRAEKFDYKEYLDLAKTSKKVVAIGECGLDFHYDGADSPEARKIQSDVFNQQIDLANELSLPVIIHCRDGYGELIDILKHNPIKKGGVAHCFGGNMQDAKDLLEMDYYLGFTGVITFKNKVEKLQEVVKFAPVDKILSETDCPYLTPVPNRGKRNEPLYVKYVVEKIAELRGFSFSEAEKITEENARKLFRI